MDDVTIETRRLTKAYGSFTAVDSLDLAIGKGEVFGLLGPNGSGKTTTILMLLGLTEPTSGQARILGFDPVRQPLQVKARAGYLPDQVGFYAGLTARENLAYTARLNGLRHEESHARIADALERMGLSSVADRKVGTFSHGMRQRLGLAELLFKNPDIMILDEPTAGLDPNAAQLLLDLIKDLSGEGITILLSSHLLRQVQQVCDRVGLFHHGRIVLEGSVADLARQVLGIEYRVKLRAEGDRAAIFDALGALPGARNVMEEGADGYAFDAEVDLRAEAARAVVEVGGGLKSLRIREPNLDEVYAGYFRQVEEVGHDRAA